MSAQTPQSQQFQCKFCQRRFKRLEHVQRHERTHTKEAPYQCPCGKAFPRGDLLRRHEKSAHNIDKTRKKRNSIYSSNGVSDQVPDIAEDPQASDWNQADPIPLEGRLSNVRRTTSHTPGPVVQQVVEQPVSLSTAQLNDHTDPSLSFLGEQNSLNIGQSNGNASHINGFHLADQIYAMDSMAFGEPGADPFDLFGEDTFLENVDFSSLFLPAGFGLDSDIQLGDHSLRDEHEPQSSIFDQSLHPKAAINNESNVDQSNSISRFGSPLPSIRADNKVSKIASQLDPSFDRATPCWKLSKSDYEAIERNIEPLLHILPNEFKLPSRHTASRYLEGCIRGLYQHMPFLHTPTWNATTAAPDLILSMLAAGCQFKFESKAITLFYAAKAAITHQIQIKDAKTIGAYSRRPGLWSHAQKHNSSNGVSQGDTPPGEPAAFGPSERDYIDSDRLQTMQATMNLMVLSSWGPKELVGEAIAFQSVLAGLVREDGLGPERNPPSLTPIGRYDRADWINWIRTESLRRTKMFVYTFTSLQSVAYNVSPCVLTNEVQINTPAGQDVWNAKTVEEWIDALSTTKIVSTSFSSAYNSLFQADSEYPPSSSIANYALIFGILNSIFMLRQSRVGLPYANSADKLRSEDVESLSGALQRWQARWEDSPESTVEPVSTNGPVAFNSTALLRLAWIRLHADLGPCRNLASRDPNLVVEAFKSCPPLQRHTGLAFPIVQAAHALSIPVRLGIAYVAKTQTLSWSVQHSLCNLECAIFVSKWFDTVASTIETTPLTAQEVGLINMFRSIVQETGFFKDEAFEPAGDVKGFQRLITHLGTATALLWAEIFSGHHVFNMVDCIGNSLGIYAKHLEDAHTPINAG